MLTIVTFGATPAMPMPLSAAPIVPATCVPWPSSSSSTGSRADSADLARPVDRRDVGRRSCATARSRSSARCRGASRRRPCRGCRRGRPGRPDPSRTSRRRSRGSSPCPTGGPAQRIRHGRGAGRRFFFLPAAAALALRPRRSRPRRRRRRRAWPPTAAPRSRRAGSDVAPSERRLRAHGAEEAPRSSSSRSRRRPRRSPTRSCLRRP